MKAGDRGTAEGVTVTVDAIGTSYRIYLPDPGADDIQSKIAHSLEPYDASALAEMAQTLSPGDLVLDIGAKVGNHTLYLCAVEECQVVSYEANPALADAIRRSSTLNRFDDLITVRTGAFSDLSLDDESFDSPVRLIRVELSGEDISLLTRARRLIARDRPDLHITCANAAALSDVDQLMIESGYSIAVGSTLSLARRYIPDEPAVSKNPSIGVVPGVSARAANFVRRALRKPRATEQPGPTGNSSADSSSTRTAPRTADSTSPSLATPPDEANPPSLVLRPWSEAPRFDEERLRIASDRAANAGARFANRGLPGRRLRVAGIVDDDTARGLGPDCEFLNLASRDWESPLADFDADLLLVTSAWLGRDASWRGLLQDEPSELMAILEWCHKRDVATVFWSLEDPTHFDTFLRAASHFDRVYLTDIDTVPLYCRELGHDRVGLLPFAAQPRIHHPIESQERKAAMVFVGEYRANQPIFVRDFEAALEGARGVIPLEILRQNDVGGSDEAAFPSSCDDMIAGKVMNDEADTSYKGYAAALNLNAVKSSNTVFEPRLLELLMSGTPTVSNYSKGARNVFGHLAPAGDSPGEVERILHQLSNADYSDRLRTQALRKVLGEHTYAHRLATIAADISGQDHAQVTSQVSVIAEVSSLDALTVVVDAVRRQVGVEVSLTIVSDDGRVREKAAESARHTYDRDSARTVEHRDIAGDMPVAVFDSLDFHGEHYLASLLQGFMYSGARVVAKREHFVCDEEGVSRSGGSLAHRTERASEVDLRRSVVLAAAISGASLFSILRGPLRLEDSEFVLAVDPFDYCLGGAGRPDVDAQVSSTCVEDVGASFDELRRATPRFESASPAADLLVLQPADLNAGPAIDQTVRLTRSGFGSLRVTRASAGRAVVMWSEKTLNVTDYFHTGRAALRLETSGDLKIHIVARWLDAAGVTLGTDIGVSNTNLDFAIPTGAARARLGYRLRAAGEGVVRYLGIGERKPVPFVYLPALRSGTLLVTTGYPSDHDRYRMGFVHSRVRGYAKYGHSVNVIVHNEDPTPSSYEFEGQEVTCGNSEFLSYVLRSEKWNQVLIHFLKENSWSVLQESAPRVPTTVWAHGVELQPWWRRHYAKEPEREKAMATTPARLDFWSQVLSSAKQDMKVVFVSQTFRQHSAEDLGLVLDSSNSAVIHNPIDTSNFQYREKSLDDRLRILSIRPYTSSLYANDLAVEAVVRLSREAWFDELEFLFVGDGPLFEETLAPLRGFGNVTIQRGFLTHTEIAALHRQHGVFLVPSRADTHGVSRDEAMSSGLVPVTTSAGSIPEFVGPAEGFVVDQEDVEGLADALRQIRLDPQRFASMSRAAAARVRNQAGVDVVIPQEIALMSRGAEVSPIAPKP